MYKFKLIQIFLLIIFSTLITHAQEDSLVNNVRQKFESFQYDKVIASTDSLLNKKDTLSKYSVMELYLMKGISHFSLQQDSMAKISFSEILKIDSTFNLDSAKTSPKIITFFNKIKQNNNYPENDSFQTANSDTVFIYKGIPDPETGTKFKNTILRSMVLPGWGHLYNNSTTKGTILTSLSALSLISVIYFIFDSNSKEDDYFNEINPKLVSEKYDKYNISYKLRNYSILTFAAAWLYAQLDLLLFSENSLIPAGEQYKTGLIYNPSTGINLTYFYAF